MQTHSIKVLSIISAFVLSGCAAYKTVPAYQGDSINFKVSDASTAYFAATSCAMDHISVPASGDFFSYNSEKNQSYALTYNFILNSVSPMLPAQNARGTLKVVVKDVDVSMTINNLDVYTERSDYSTGGFGKIIFAGQNEEASVKVKQLLNDMKICVENHI